MHAGRRVAEPGSDLAGREPVNEVRAHRLVATLRRLGGLKEILGSDPHTSTDLPEQHHQSVERLSDRMARPTPLAASASLESERFQLVLGSSPSASRCKRLGASEAIVQTVPLRSGSAVIARAPKQRQNRAPPARHRRAYPLPRIEANGCSGRRGAARREQRGGLDEPVAPVPYIFIAPEDPSAIGEIAQRVYRKHYRRAWSADARDLWLLGRVLDAGADAMHGELLSYVFFAGEFAEELIRLGQADACRWIDEHPTDLWQLDPLPDWSHAPNGDTAIPSSPQPAPAHTLAAASKFTTRAPEGSNGSAE